jgi:hypothetical protein
VRAAATKSTKLSVKKKDDDVWSGKMVQNQELTNWASAQCNSAFSQHSDRLKQLTIQNRKSITFVSALSQCALLCSLIGDVPFSAPALFDTNDI